MDKFKPGDRVRIIETRFPEALNKLALVARGRGPQSDGGFRYLIELDDMRPSPHPDGFKTHPTFFAVDEDQLEHEFH